MMVVKQIRPSKMGGNTHLGLRIILRDPGKNKIWQGFFLPEHIKMLKEAHQDYHKSPSPQLTERQIEVLERLLLESLQD